MSKRGRNKDPTVQRSEYSDDILRNNQRSGNRLKIDMTYYDRAQKVIMKDIGKETLLLQSKLDSDKKTLSLGLFGSQFGVSGPNSSRKYTPSGTGYVMTSKQTPRMSSRTEKGSKFPWERDAQEKDISMEPDTRGLASAHTKHSSRLSQLSSYSVNRPPADDFLTSILNEAKNDQLMYTQSIQQTSPYKKEEALKPPRSARRKSKTPRHRVLMEPGDSLVNSLSSAAMETDEVIY